MTQEAAAAIALAAEIKRRAQGPDHVAHDAITWRDLGRVLEATERRGPHVLPVALIAYYNPGWWP